MNKVRTVSRVLCLVISVVLVFALSWLIPRSADTVCTSHLDCGFDVGRTDINDIKPYGIPFVSHSVTISRSYGDRLDVITHEDKSTDNKGVVLNSIIWAAAALVLYRFTLGRNKKA